MGNVCSCDRRARGRPVELADPDGLAEWWARIQSPELGAPDTTKRARAAGHQELMKRGGFSVSERQANTFLEQNAVLAKTKLIYRFYVAVFLSFCAVMLLLWTQPATSITD